MSTSGDEIRDYIIEEMANYPNIDQSNQALIDIMTCIGNGVYRALQNLDDTSGMPASTGHQ